jgi:agmatinase
MSAAFDPNAAARPESGIFGLDCSAAEAAVHLLPVPFDGTASYRRGTARAPHAILAASHQVDLFDLVTGRPYEAGIWMAGVHKIAQLDELQPERERVEMAQELLNAWLQEQSSVALEQGKLVGVLGGEHSVPFGSIQAHAGRYPGIGLLHFDAHADLREAYEGFTWSHASILRNVLERIPSIGPIVQVGLRDLCEEEHALIRSSRGKIHTVFDHEWAAERLSGRPLAGLVRRAIEPLPSEVYVTFDVDGLDPSLCPNTGTPVPGGLRWDEAMLWLDELVRSGRSIVGFDLCEVAPAPGSSGEGWDEIVGARLLYRLIGFALMSRSD